MNNFELCNNEIFKFLENAEMEHVRFYWLFPKPYFQNNPEKRTLAAKRYVLLKTCQELAESKDFTIKDIFEVYKGFKSASIKNYHSFTRKLKQVGHKDATSCIHGRIGTTVECKLNPYTIALIHRYLSCKEKYSYNQVKNLVNQSIIAINERQGSNFSTISKSTIAQYFNKNKNEINYYREGKEFFDKQMGLI